MKLTKRSNIKCGSDSNSVVSVRIEDVKENRYGKGSNYISDDDIKKQKHTT